MCLVPAYQQESLNEITPKLLAWYKFKVHLVPKVVFTQRIMYVYIHTYKYGAVMRGEELYFCNLYINMSTLSRTGQLPVNKSR